MRSDNYNQLLQMQRTAAGHQDSPRAVGESVRMSAPGAAGSGLHAGANGSGSELEQGFAAFKIEGR